MARGITQAQVNEAADALLAAGERPTLERVRGKLGTGSPNTIAKLLDGWWATLSARLAAALSVATAPDPIQALTRELWGAALAHARGAAAAEIEAERSGLHARELEMQTREAELVAAQEALRVQSDHAALRQSSLEATNAGLRSDLAQESARAGETSRALSDALATIRDLQAQLAGAHSAAERREKALRRDLERMEAQEARWLRELDRVRLEHKALQTELTQEKRLRQRATQDGRRTGGQVRAMTDVAHQLKQQRDNAPGARKRSAKPTAQNRRRAASSARLRAPAAR